MDEPSGGGVQDTHWLRPWAATFDLIASEYGWTDDQILDLTLGRMRQIREVIVSRQEMNWRRIVRLEEAKLRHLAGAVYSAANNRKGAKWAATIELMERSDVEAAAEAEAKIPSLTAASRMFPVDGTPGLGLIDPEELAAKIAEIKAERGEE